MYDCHGGMYDARMATRPVILEHGVSATKPVARKVSRVDQTGPGLTDMHWAAEIGIIRHGRMRRRSGAWMAEYGPGDVYLQGIWEVQSAEILEAPFEAIMLHVYSPYLASLNFPEGPAINWLGWFTGPPDQRPSPKVSARPTWLAFADRIAAVHEDSGWQAHVHLRLLLMEILLALSHVQAPPIPGARPASGDGAGIGPALALAFAADGSVTLAKAAAACRMGALRFDHTFRSLMGMSFMRFMLAYRLQGAARSLTDSDLPIKSIAAEWGFTDASHLHRHFQRAYGMAPIAWRTQGKR